MSVVTRAFSPCEKPLGEELCRVPKLRTWNAVSTGWKPVSHVSHGIPLNFGFVRQRLAEQFGYAVGADFPLSETRQRSRGDGLGLGVGIVADEHHFQVGGFGLQLGNESRAIGLFEAVVENAVEQ